MWQEFLNSSHIPFIWAALAWLLGLNHVWNFKTLLVCKTQWTLPSWDKSSRNRATIYIIQQLSFWAYIWKRQKTLIRKDTCTPVFIAALFTIAKIWKQPMSFNIKMDKEYGLLISHKKWNSAICNNVGGPRVH